MSLRRASRLSVCLRSIFVVLFFLLNSLSVESHELSMPVGEKRTLTNEERIQLEEEERYLKASRGILEDRLAKVQDELESARIQERQLKEQIENIGGQLQTQKENRARQMALQLELNRSLSKTREAYMKVVTESMSSGALRWKEGLSFIVDETVKEILTMDEMNGPHAIHRCQGMQNTCLDIRTFFPQPVSGAGNGDFDIPDMIQSTCPSYINEGHCFDQDCPHHQLGEPRIPQQLEPLPDPMLPDIGVVDEGEIPPRGSTISSWWLENHGKVTLSYETVALSTETVMKAIGVRISDRKLLLERASSETASAADNVARYVDGFLFGLHAGVVTGPFDLQYLATVLEDLSFPPHLVDRVKKEFANAATFVWPDACLENFRMQVEFLRATLAHEKLDDAFSCERDTDETCMDTIQGTWKARKERLLTVESKKLRKIEALSVILPVCKAVLKTLEKASLDLSRGEVTELEHVYHKVDRALLSSLYLVFDDTFSQILLTPLFAANISLACNLKLYQKAHARLESLLNYGQGQKGGVDDGVNLLVFSEVLWSQLLQLRVCLPPTNVDSSQLSNYKSYLNDFLEDLGIVPKHVKPVVGRVK